MNDKIYLEKAVKYLGKLLNAKPLRNTTEIKEVKETREYLNGMMDEKKKIRSKNANSYLCSSMGKVFFASGFFQDFFFIFNFLKLQHDVHRCRVF